MTRMNDEAEALTRGAQRLGQQLLRATGDLRRAWGDLAMELVQNRTPAQLAGAVAAAALDAVLDAAAADDPPVGLAEELDRYQEAAVDPLTGLLPLIHQYADLSAAAPGEAERGRALTAERLDALAVTVEAEIRARLGQPLPSPADEPRDLPLWKMADSTAGCPVSPRCASCETTVELMAVLITTPVGLGCLTLCPDCDNAGKVPGVGSLADAYAMVLRHGEHLGVDLPHLATAVAAGLPAAGKESAELPANWPPLDGDVWTDRDDVRWVAQTWEVNDEVRCSLQQIDGNTSATPDRVLEIAAPLMLTAKGWERSRNERAAEDAACPSTSPRAQAVLDAAAADAGCPVCGAPTGGAPCPNQPAGSPPGTPSCADLVADAARPELYG